MDILEPLIFFNSHLSFMRLAFVCLLSVVLSILCTFVVPSPVTLSKTKQDTSATLAAHSAQASTGPQTQTKMLQ